MHYFRYCKYSLKALAHLGYNALKREYLLLKVESEQPKIPSVNLYNIFLYLACNSDNIAFKKGGTVGFPRKQNV